MNLQDVMDTPQYQELTGRIMAAAGLDQPAEFYNSVFAYDRRCAAVAQLSAVILAHSQDGEPIAPPVEDLIRFARTCANGLEKDPMSLQLTHDVMETVIYGHIWLAQQKKPFNRAMAKQGCEQILMSMIGFGRKSGGPGGCSGNCGSCGGH
jgi:hypothetical protein